MFTVPFPLLTPCAAVCIYDLHTILNKMINFSITAPNFFFNIISSVLIIFLWIYLSNNQLNQTVQVIVSIYSKIALQVV